MKYLLSAVLLWGITTVSLFAKSPILHSKVKNVDIKEFKGIPNEINYQGWIGDAIDTNEINDTLDMNFRLYDTETGGTLLWNETQSAVNVNKGIFNVLLGSVSSISSNIFTGAPLWLETQVENDTLTPRKKLVSVGYAIKSEEAEHSVYSDTASYVVGGAGDNDWTISGNNMYSAVSGSVGIGVSSPTEKLDVNGAVNTSSFYKIEGNTVLADSGTGNIFVGVGAGISNTTGSYNTFSGYQAGRFNITGYRNTFSGYQAGQSNTTGHSNTFLGSYAGYTNTEGNYNTFSGYQAGRFNTTGLYNTLSGCLAGHHNTTGRYNTFSGYQAGYSNTTGICNTLLGYNAGYNNIESDSSVFIGNWAGYKETGSNKLYIANDSTDTNVLIYGEFDNRRVGIGTTSPTANLDVNGNCKADTFIGDGSQLTGISGTTDNDWIISGSDIYSAVSGNVGVGVVSPTEKLDVDGTINTSSFYKIGGNTVLSSIDTNNIFVGVGTGENNTTGYCNAFFGDSTGFSNTTGFNNTFSGYQAGYSNTTGRHNTFLGCQAGYSNIAYDANTFLGSKAGYKNIGPFNTFSGFYAGYSNTTGSNNTFLGCYVGLSNTTGTYNTFLGNQVGHFNTTGDSSVFIGNQAGYNETGSNKLYIANGQNDANVLIYGEFDNRRVGIGTTSPTAALDVNGANGYDQIRMRTSFTPTGTADTNGNTGDIAWDDSYVYIKTSVGWKRTTLSTF